MPLALSSSYPVKFGWPDLAPAAGALPPLPELPLPPLDVVSVEVVSVAVVSVDVESVELELDRSGVVVVIVVTTVEPPVVTVETIVVVAWAPNGAAPAVNAAVAAPSVISTAKAEPQRANLRYLLIRDSLPRSAPRYSHHLLERHRRLFNGFHVHPRPGNFLVLDAEDHHAADLEPSPAPGRPVRMPYSLQIVVPCCTAAGTSTRRSGASAITSSHSRRDVVPAAHCRRWMAWTLGDVVLADELHEGVEIVRVQGRAHAFH